MQSGTALSQFAQPNGTLLAKVRVRHPHSSEPQPLHAQHEHACRADPHPVHEDDEHDDDINPDEGAEGGVE